MSESIIQQQIVIWYNNNYCLKTHTPRGIIWATPNGGTRNIKEAMSLKASGVLSGVSDLILILPNGKLVFVEVKHGKNKQSEAQVEFQNRVENLGFEYLLVYSLEDFIDKILFLLK